MYQYALFHDKTIPSGHRAPDSGSYIRDVTGGNLGHPGAVELEDGSSAGMDGKDDASTSNARRKLRGDSLVDGRGEEEEDAIIEIEKAIRNYLSRI